MFNKIAISCSECWKSIYSLSLSFTDIHCYYILLSEISRRLIAPYVINIQAHKVLIHKFSFLILHCRRHLNVQSVALLWICLGRTWISSLGRLISITWWICRHINWWTGNNCHLSGMVGAKVKTNYFNMRIDAPRVEQYQASRDSFSLLSDTTEPSRSASRPSPQCI